jgi:type I restriction enzyme, S subunit
VRLAHVAYPDTLIRIRFNPERVNSSFAALIWDAPIVRRQLEDAARTTAGIYKINQRSLGDIRIPVPALSEQQEILAAAEAKLSRVEEAEGAVKMSDARARQLRYAILSAAFSGKLAAQDSRDEPASDLLERTAAQRTAVGGHKAVSKQPRVEVSA